MKCRDRSTLSPREQAVYDLLSQGLTKKAIAEQLGISVCAVTALRTSILAALVKAGTVRYFLLNGIGGGGGFGGGDNASSWVTSNCKTITSSAWGESSSASGG